MKAEKLQKSWTRSIWGSEVLNGFEKVTERLNCQIKADYFLQSPNPEVMNEDSTLKASERLDMEEEWFKKRKTAIFLRTDMTSDMIRVRMNTKLKIPVSLYKADILRCQCWYRTRTITRPSKTFSEIQRESREKQSIVFITTAAIQKS